MPVGSRVHLNSPLCPQVTLVTACLQALGVFYSSGEVLSSQPEEWKGPALLASLPGPCDFPHTHCQSLELFPASVYNLYLLFALRRQSN